LRWTFSKNPWVREKLGLATNAKLSTSTLNEILRGNIDAEATSCPFAAGFRRQSNLWAVNAALRKRRPTSRRFEVARLLGDNLFATPADSVLPITETETARQKIQRSFAQELLCPAQGLREFRGSSYPDEELVAEAAEHYEVSDWTVISALVNKGLCSRDLLDLMH
jgi:Zn-dependent peptidase ImmA (M78 family)